MNNNISQIHDINSSVSTNSKKINSGSQVLVRVIKNLGNGKYEGSVAGVRTLFTAKSTLTTGSSFLAKISVSNGKILLAPNSLSSIQNKSELIALLNTDVFNRKLFERVTEPNILNVLNQMNLPSDVFSFHLLQQFKQLDMKFESNILLKIRALAVKFPGKEKQISELLSNLAKKNIFVSESELKDLLNQIESKKEKGNLSAKKNVYRSEQSEQIDFENILKSFFKVLMKGINQDNIGLLTVMNQCCCKNENSVSKSWIYLPFEIIENNNETYEIKGNGFLKLFFLNTKEIRFININCELCNKQYSFLITFENNQCKKICFNVNESKDNIEILNELIKLKEHFGNQNIEIVWTDSSMINGNACASEEVYVFSGEI